MTVADWHDLSDSELRQRLERRLAGDAAMARSLVERRDEERVARWIDGALRHGVLGIDPETGELGGIIG